MRWLCKFEDLTLDPGTQAETAEHCGIYKPSSGQSETGGQTTGHTGQPARPNGPVKVTVAKAI